MALLLYCTPTLLIENLPLAAPGLYYFLHMFRVRLRRYWAVIFIPMPLPKRFYKLYTVPICQLERSIANVSPLTNVSSKYSPWIIVCFPKISLLV